jgi:outer membrane protein TolC
MNVKGILTVATVLILSGKISAQDTTICLTIEKACELGIENNVNVKNAELDRQKTRFQLKEVQSKMFPQIEAYSTFSYYYAIPKMIVPGEIFGQTGLIPIEIGTKFDWNSGFKATQLLFSRSFLTALDMAKQMQELGSLTVVQQKEEVVYQVSKLFYICKNIEKQRECIRQNIASMERLADITRLQSENGVIRKTDHSRVLVNISNLRTQEESIAELLQQQIRLLKYLTGIKANSEIKLAGWDESDIIRSASEPASPDKRIDIQLLDKQIQLTGLAKRSKKQEYFPTLSGFGQYYYQGQRNSFDFFSGGDNKFYKVGVVGLSLNIPIFDGNEKRSKIKAYDIELKKLENTRQNAIEFMLKDFTDAVNQCRVAYDAAIRQKENVKLAEETYGITLQGYKEGVISLSDLLFSDNSLSEARLSYYNSLIKLKESELDLRKAKGELLILEK